jgi:hypothetical protein
LVLCTASKIRVFNLTPRRGVRRVLPGDFRVIVCPTSPQMNDFCDLLGTPDAPVSKIASVKWFHSKLPNIGTVKFSF